MGSLHKQEFASGEFCSRAVGLQAHLTSNFYPPLTNGLRKAITSAFNDHWRGELTDHDKLAKRCHLHDTSALYQYFDAFMDI